MIERNCLQFTLIYLLHYCKSIAWLTWGNIRFQWIAPNYGLEFCCRLITFLAITVPQEVDLQMEIQSRLHLFLPYPGTFHLPSLLFLKPFPTSGNSSVCVYEKALYRGYFPFRFFSGKRQVWYWCCVWVWAQEITVSTCSNFGMMNSKQNLTISYFLVVFTLSCLVLVCGEEWNFLTC